MFCQKFLTQIKSRILTITIVVTSFVEEPIFLCQGEQVLIFLGIQMPNCCL